MDEKRMADVNVAGAARGIGAWTLVRRRRQVSDYIAEVHSVLSKGREHSRDIEMRADQYICRGVLRTDVCE